MTEVPSMVDDTTIAFLLDGSLMFPGQQYRLTIEFDAEGAASRLAQYVLIRCLL